MILAYEPVDSKFLLWIVWDCPHSPVRRRVDQIYTATRQKFRAYSGPTMAESGLPGFDIEGFLGLLAPAKTPRTVINKLSEEIAKIAKQPDFIARYAGFGMRPVGSTPEEIDRFTRAQIAKWAKVLKQAGYTPN